MRTPNKDLSAAGRAALPFLTLLLCLPGAPCAESTPFCRDCSVILISIDTLRPDRLGCYGYGVKTSPNMDRLAENGLVFDNFVAQSDITPISMASIFTSLYPHESGYVNFSSTLSSETGTLPEIFSASGYMTAAFTSAPEFNLTMNPFSPPSPHPVFSRGFAEYRISPKRRKAATADILKWLETNKRSRFFLWLPIGDVHFPYGANASSETRRSFGLAGYSGPLTDPDWAATIGRIYKGVFYPPYSRVLKARPAPVVLERRDTDHIKNSYDAGIFTADMIVGEIAAKLKALNLHEKTLVVIHSIHAEDMGERGYYGHYDIHDTELRGVLIFNGPRVRPGRVKRQVSGLDLAPTLLDFAGMPVLPRARGKSLLPVLSGRAEPGPGYVFSIRLPYWEQLLLQSVFTYDSKTYDVRKDFTRLLERALGTGWDPSSVDVSVQSGGWKLIHRNSAAILPVISWWGFISGQTILPSPEYELYHLTDDPLETSDLYEKEPAIAKELGERIGDFENGMKNRMSSETVLKSAGLQQYP